MNKKEEQINKLQEINRKQEKEIINLINQNNKMNNYNKDSLLLMKEIKNKNDLLYNEYENLNQKMNSIKGILQEDDNIEKMILEFKNIINEENDYINNNINLPKESNNLDYKEINQYKNNISPFKKDKNDKIKSEYDKNNINNINNIVILDDTNKNRNYIYDYSDNKDEITMKKKYDFLFQNKNK